MLKNLGSKDIIDNYSFLCFFSLYSYSSPKKWTKYQLTTCHFIDVETKAWNN